jgi:hypothetical protein
LAQIDDVLPDDDVHDVRPIACARPLDEALATIADASIRRRLPKRIAA